MHWIALPLFMAAAAPQPKPMVAQTHAVASVQIVAGEEVRFDDIRKPSQKTTQRQKRVRDRMPMVEFF